jgi:hypothetical protein
LPLMNTRADRVRSRKALIATAAGLVTATAFAVVSIGFFASIGGLLIVGFWSVLAAAIVGLGFSQLMRYHEH